MNCRILPAILLIAIGCTAPAQEKTKHDFTVAEKREKPACKEEQAVHDILSGKTSGLSIEKDKPKDGKPNFRVEKWGPHLFNVGWPDAGNKYDITVFTSEDDERRTASAIRVKFKRIFRELGRTEEHDTVFLVAPDGKHVGQLPGGDAWTRPYLDYQRTSGKKARATGR